MYYFCLCYLSETFWCFHWNLLYLTFFISSPYLKRISFSSWYLEMVGSLATFQCKNPLSKPTFCFSNPKSQPHFCAKKTEALERHRGYPKLYSEETFSEPCQTSKTEPFAKIVNGWKASSIFAKRLNLRWFIGFWIRLCTQ